MKKKTTKPWPEYARYLRHKNKLVRLLKRCEALIRKDYPRFTLDTVPANDPLTIRQFLQDALQPVMNLDSYWKHRGFKSFLRMLRLKSMEDIATGIALYRMGPMEKGLSKKYVEGGIRYRDPAVKRCLAMFTTGTRGQLVFQEQIHEVVKALAGFSTAEAGSLRRALGPRQYELPDWRARFVRGAMRRGIRRTVAEGLFDAVERQGRYAFNRVFALETAALAHRLAYVRRHYRREFLAATRNQNE